MKCLFCGSELSNRQKKFCSSKCQGAYFSQQKIKAWKSGEETGLKGAYQIANYIRKYMLEKAENRCELCGWHEINPFSGLIPLEIHHKDGDYRNNNEENLQVLCPNCHSLTSSYKALNKEGRKDRDHSGSRKRYNTCVDCGVQISDKALRCRACEGKMRITEKRVSREELKILIRTTPFTKIGEQFGVSDNTIKKWCDGYGLPRTKREIKTISDEDWESL